LIHNGQLRAIIDFEAVGHPSNTLSLIIVSAGNENNFVAALDQALRERVLVHFYAALHQ
jgi:hypothetical protein